MLASVNLENHFLFLESFCFQREFDFFDSKFRRIRRFLKMDCKNCLKRLKYITNVSLREFRKSPPRLGYSVTCYVKFKFDSFGKLEEFSVAQRFHSRFLKILF